MFDSPLPISYYKKIAALHEEHGVFVVQHVSSGKIFLQKEMKIYDLEVFEKLFKEPISFIPRIYALYEENSVLTLIEEYISGDNLQEILDLGGSFTEQEVIDYGIQLCDILTNLHSMEPPIVHRDLKPSNILLTESGHIFLIDLNAAKISDSSKARDTRLIGTAGFAAPEQYGFAASTPLTDLFSLGKLMMALLPSQNEIEQSIASTLNAGDLPCSKKLAEVIARCLQLDPKDRFKSAKQLKTALQKASGHFL